MKGGMYYGDPKMNILNKREILTAGNDKRKVKSF